MALLYSVVGLSSFSEALIELWFVLTMEYRSTTLLTKSMCLISRAVIQTEGQGYGLLVQCTFGSFSLCALCVRLLKEFLCINRAISLNGSTLKSSQ